jgi:uncharacterized protein with PIN domain
MSAKRDSFLDRWEFVESDDIVCEQCGEVLTQVFAEVVNEDKEGPYGKCRGHCDKCDKEMWSEVIR